MARTRTSPTHAEGGSIVAGRFLTVLGPDHLEMNLPLNKTASKAVGSRASTILAASVRGGRVEKATSHLQAASVARSRHQVPLKQFGSLSARQLHELNVKKDESLIRRAKSIMARPSLWGSGSAFVTASPQPPIRLAQKRKADTIMEQCEPKRRLIQSEQGSNIKQHSDSGLTVSSASPRAL
ncbi:hypothetical protein BAUCODRAFT_147716 [Baudoinia panamericana UAMH 10762]|uniref:Uncharacterized protein n=1 Tax=Baudoinia panamericana (strain UAMH 10762) TaxID=717646 RepID=M2LT28_BAUPA|nr:uncharacterized protein BAUCODRAFT_147716 [Baudoinia panamericana UAMH 10762]EMC97667.1 hypothetical protein BAUCODRAFT_147716 [Baudoinia panamericana UAMH 10762]